MESHSKSHEGPRMVVDCAFMMSVVDFGSESLLM